MIKTFSSLLKITILTILISLIIISCNNNKSKKEGANINNVKKTTKLKWLAHWKGEGKKENLIYEIARDFSFHNQDVEIEIEFPHDMLNITTKQSFYGGTVDTISQMVRHDNWPYDVMLCGIYLHNSVADQTGDKNWAKKHLVDFSNEQWFIDAHKNNLFSNDRYTRPYGDLAPGPYIEGNWNVLYKSDIVEKKLGINIKKTDMSFDDFIAAAKSVYEYNQSHSDKITFFSLQKVDSPNLLLTHLAMSILGKPKPSNKVEAISALRTAYQQLNKLAVYDPLKQYHPSNDNSNLDEKNTLFILHPSWINMIWQRSNPKGEKMMTPCEMPSLKDKTASSYSGIYHAIFVAPKKAKNKEAAMRFIKFISSKDVADKWIKYSQCPTGLKNSISYTDFGESSFAKFSRHISKKYNSQYSEDYLMSTLFDHNARFEYPVNDVITGKLSPEEALQIILNEVNK